MEVSLIISGCLLAAFFAAGILFERWVLSDESERPQRSASNFEARQGAVPLESAEESGKPAAAKKKVSVEEQWDNLLRYDGVPQRKGGSEKEIL